jgi:hypothetical protein
MKYFYGMTERGFAPMCQPTEDLVEAIEDTSDTFYNILVYDRRLSNSETKQYELIYLGKVEDDDYYKED